MGKGQKDAVRYLEYYVRSRNEDDFVKYVQSMAVPLNDHYARLVLQSDEVDRDKARQYFLNRQIHVEDIDGMIRFFIYFEHFPYMSDAIAIWTQADQLILRLQVVGDGLRTALKNNNAPTIGQLVGELKLLSVLFSDLEYRFSLVLQVGCSLGISLYPDGCDDELTMTCCADAAMYAAKASERNTHYFFNRAK